MKKGSLITPSKRFFEELPFMNRMKIQFLPKVPERGDIFVCASDPYLYSSDSSNPVIDIEDLSCFARKGMFTIDIALNTYLFDEVQPPEEVSIPNIMESVKLHEEVITTIDELSV